MAIDFGNPAHVIVVHGVQTGENDRINCDKQIAALLNRALAASHIVDRQFAVRGFFYEDHNDRAQKFFQHIARAITRGSPLKGKALRNVIDLVGDVVIGARNTSTAHQIRRELKAEIVDSFRTGNQAIVVAHSLGTIYALDVVNDLIRDSHFFDGDDLTTWPVQGLVTMGSPLGLAMEILGVRLFEKRDLATVRNARFSLFPWHNYFNPLDPVVSGNVFGRPVRVDVTSGPVEKRYGPDLLDTNWKLRGHVVTSGEQWLFAHTQYWSSSSIGDRLLDMLWG